VNIYFNKILAHRFSIPPTFTLLKFSKLFTIMRSYCLEKDFHIHGFIDSDKQSQLRQVNSDSKVRAC